MEKQITEEALQKLSKSIANIQEVISEYGTIEKINIEIKGFKTKGNECFLEHLNTRTSEGGIKVKFKAESEPWGKSTLA